MSLYSYQFGREAPIAVQLDGTSPIELASGGNNGATVLALRLAEVAGATPTVTLDIYDGAAVVAEIAHLRAFTAKEMWEAIRLDGVPVHLLPGQTLRVTASAANQVHVTGIVIEVT